MSGTHVLQYTWCNGILIFILSQGYDVIRRKWSPLRQCGKETFGDGPRVALDVTIVTAQITK